MRTIQALLCVLLCGGLAGSLEARGRKGDRVFFQGRVAEAKNDWDTALTSYQQAVTENPEDVEYQMAMSRARFQAGQSHVNKGQKLRKAGQLEEALEEFLKAQSIDGASSIAVQEIRRTREMIDRKRRSGGAH